MAKINLTARLEPQPTLALYLGGSGVKTGKLILPMLESVPDEARGMVEAFFIDSQAPEIDLHERARHYCYRDLTMFDGPIYEDFKRQRMPLNLGTEPVMNSCDGCGITRIFGAASLAACRDDFLELLSGAVGRLKRLRSDGHQGLQVFLTASACGGTGAGMLIDAAALVRHHLAEALGEHPRIFAFLFGPDAFVDDAKIGTTEQKERMMASSYALLKELHHFAAGGSFKSGYRLRDKPVEIRNDSSGNRLFEWIFYVDGKTEGGQATRSLDELAWIVAETQFHLAMSGVGRKIRESLPNQREQRARQYAADYVHPENREGQLQQQRDSLEISARRSCLAGLSVQSVRFPGPEIADLERARWSVEALAALLEREGALEGESILVKDRIIGVEAGIPTGGGLLQQVGATQASLQELLSFGGWTVPPRNANPEVVLTRGNEILSNAEALLHRRTGNLQEKESDRQAFEKWKRGWTEYLTQPEGLSQFLFELAGDATNGRGLRWLRSFLEHAIHFLETRRPGMPLEADWQEIENCQQEARNKLQGLRKSVTRDKKNLILKARGLANRLLKEGSGSEAFSPVTVNRVPRTREALLALADRAEELQKQAALPLLEALIFRQMADDLKDWQRQHLQPLLGVLAAAKNHADSRYELAQAKLKNRGSRFADEEAMETTVSVMDETLLDELRDQAETSLSVIDLVVRPFFGQGLVHGRTRLSVQTAHQLTTETVADTVAQVVAAAAEAQLSWLRQGWLLPAARARLGAAAEVLDRGAEPLVAYANAAVGVRTQRYLLTPKDLVLPIPFGRSIDFAQRFISRDPMQLSVLSFAFGIPPNALQGIESWLSQYCLHLGDDAEEPELQRFPLHVFRGAAERFDEPCSPLDLASHPNYLDGLRDLVLSDEWEADICLDIRPTADLAAALTSDINWNLVIELSNRIVRAARHRMPLADKVRTDPRLEPLRRRLFGDFQAAWSRSQKSQTSRTPHKGDGHGQNHGPVDAVDVDQHSSTGNDHHPD